MPEPPDTADRPLKAQFDDWSGREPIATVKAREGQADDKGVASTDETDTSATDDDGGLRRAPDLQVEVALSPEDTDAAREFAFDDDRAPDEAEEDAVRAASQNRRFRTVARQAALDPNDGIDL